MQNYRSFLFKTLHFRVIGSHGARAWPTGTKEIAWQNSACEKRGRKQGSKKDAPTARDRAVKSGLIPKARNCYCLFTKDEMKKDEYAGVPWPVAAKRISQAWKQLDDQGRAMYQQMAKQEINEQHEAMVEHGLRKQADGVSAEEHGGHGGVTPFDAQTVQYGRYVLLRQGEIGRGTFGRVMVAKERNTERRVALKVFEDEAEAKLEISMYTYMSSMGGHRNILPLLEHGTNLPTPFLTLPYVPGLNVRDAFKEGSVSASDWIGMASQLAEGMTWLHTHTRLPTWT